MAEAALLQVRGLTRRFGALAANDGIDLDVAEGGIHAVIGPNGAGKSTLIAQLAGEQRPDAGRIRFAGADITRWPAHRRARAGLGRSFQVSQVVPEFTVLENVALAVQAREGHSFRFWRPFREDYGLHMQASQALARVGLADRPHLPAVALAHGQRRRLELAMVLAGRPRLMLLDEPMAGLGPEEIQQLSALLAELREEVTILLVEHDMDVVFGLSDAITVLIFGRDIITGPPAAIRASREVRRAYLGDAG